MAQLQEYKCPCCGGSVEFNSQLQKMKCPYCDSEFAMEELAALDSVLSEQLPDENLEWEETPGQEWTEEELNGMHAYVCQSCGGEIVTDPNTIATSCPYCDNPVVMMAKVSGMLKPDVIIPFRVDKNAAKAALQTHYMGKRLLPKVFKDQNHIEEIKGIYVPFWLFDAGCDANVQYEGKKVRSWSDSHYHYTETSHYLIQRDGSMAFARVPVDGSSKLEDDLMESIEPFDFRAAVPFQTAYMSGYLADKYDVDEKSSIGRANERIRSSVTDSFRSTVRGYQGVTVKQSNIRLKNGKAVYALFPVWILNTKWNGTNYRFAMNGQTGKFVGNLPLDKQAYQRHLFGIAGGVAAVVFAVLSLVWLI